VDDLQRVAVSFPVQVPLEDRGDIAGQKVIAGSVRSQGAERRREKKEAQKDGAQATGEMERGVDTRRQRHVIFPLVQRTGRRG
jgi:hypothetical protein